MLSLVSLSGSQHLWVRLGFHQAVFCFLCLLRAEDRQVYVSRITMSVWLCARHPQSSHLPILFCPHPPEHTAGGAFTLPLGSLEKEPGRSGNPILFQNRVGLALQPKSIYPVLTQLMPRPS